MGWRLALGVTPLKPPGSKFRHCEPTGRANARPMTGSAKQSRGPKRKNGLLRRFAPRNDVEGPVVKSRAQAYQDAMANQNTAPILFDRALLRARQQRARKRGAVTFLLDRVAEDIGDRLRAVTGT